jgi:hypothetical protein
MAIVSILDLPREIRDRIYIFAVCSSSGYVYHHLTSSDTPTRKLIPFSPPAHVCLRDSIALSLLQTCRQIHQEAEDAIYKHNIWVGGSVREFVSRFSKVRTLHGPRLRHIWLQVEMSERTDLDMTSEALKILRTWAEQGCRLQTVTLRVVTGKVEMSDVADLHRWAEEFEEKFGKSHRQNANMLLDEYMRIFRRECGLSEWPGVQRKLEFEAEQIRERCSEDPGGIVELLHDSFGGELWFRERLGVQSSDAEEPVFKDRLCYKDGTELLRPFAKCAGSRGWQLAWFKGDDDQFWGRNGQSMK